MREAERVKSKSTVQDRVDACYLTVAKVTGSFGDDRWGYLLAAAARLIPEVGGYKVLL